MPRKHIVLTASTFFLATCAQPDPPVGGDDTTSAEDPSTFAIAGPPQERSGTRLKLRVDDAGDGAYLNRGNYDSELEEDCRFTKVSTDGYVCMPSFSTWLVYLDSNCTQPAALTDHDSKDMWFAHLRSVGCDGSRTYDYFELGDVLDVDPEALHRMVEDSCETLSIAGRADRAIQAIASIAPPSLPEGHLVVEEGEARVRQTFIETDDGARVFAGPKDMGLDESCKFPLFSLDSPCLSNDWGRVDSNWYEDSGCTEPLVRLDDSSCSKPRYAYDAPMGLGALGAGPSDIRFFEIGMRYEAETLGYLSQASCSTKSADEEPGSAFHSLGDEVDASIVPWSAQGLFGSGRLLLQDARNEDYNRLYSMGARFYDTQLESQCFPKELCDGTLACLNETAPRAQEWADPNCTLPLATETMKFVLAQGDCEGDGQIYRVNEDVYDGAVYSNGFGAARGECEETEWGEWNPPLHTTTPATNHPFALLKRGYLSESKP